VEGLVAALDGDAACRYAAQLRSLMRSELRLAAESSKQWHALALVPVVI